jgi:D-aminopeptidase
VPRIESAQFEPVHSGRATITLCDHCVYNSMFKATTVTGNGHTVEALPIEKVVDILKEHRLIRQKP